jgi:hypothetical protein
VILAGATDQELLKVQTVNAKEQTRRARNKNLNWWRQRRSQRPRAKEQEVGSQQHVDVGFGEQLERADKSECPLFHKRHQP